MPTNGSPSPYQGEGDKKNAPPPADYTALAQQQAGAQQQAVDSQTYANRPEISTPYAQQHWSKGMDGKWYLSTGFTGQLGQTSDALQQQVAGNLGAPLDFSSFGPLGTGDAARRQAIESAYNSSASRLDPQWAQREEATRSRLLNSGLQEGSEAYEKAMNDLSMGRNDAYQQALASAIAQGTAAGSTVFNNNLAARQQGISEMLRMREQPLSDLQSLQGFLATPSFTTAGLASAPNYLQAAQLQDASNYRTWQQESQNSADAWSAGIEALSKIASTVASAYAMSDERAKAEVHRTQDEVLPGVHAAVFRYKPEMGMGDDYWVGVVAQDLAQAYPELVRKREDGLLMVHPTFAPLKLES